MEELILTSPVTDPAKTTTKYRVISVTLDLEAPPQLPNLEIGAVIIFLRSNLNEPLWHSYHGNIAVTMIKQLNTANLSTKSLHKRVLERLSTDGIISGIVNGAPDS